MAVTTQGADLARWVRLTMPATGVVDSPLARLSRKEQQQLHDLLAKAIKPETFDL